MGPQLATYQSLWAMEDLPFAAAQNWTLAERVEQIAAAGFTGLAVDLGAREAPAAAALAPLAGAAGLRTAVFAFVSDDAGVDDALRYADTIGAPDLVVCAQVFEADLAVVADTVRRWHATAARAGVTLQLETHRGTATNDLRATVRLLELLDPAIELAVDLSHHVCGCELPDEPTDVVEALVAAVLARTGSIQGRVATRGQVQVPLAFPQHARWVDRFLGWWVAGFAAARVRRAAAGDARDIAFCAELGTRPYAITGADGRELSDRWAEALQLKEWAHECFAASAAPTEPRSRS
ncbi:MAG: hypothetical protein QOI42_323 [Frankiaceae bacterium]|nr:hypothetical protein [Frankiaceae bacterium]